MNFKAICDRIIVQRDAAVETSHLMIPEKVKKAPRSGSVLSVGAEVKYTKVGDKVFFNEYAGQYLEPTQDLTESELISMREDEVLAIEEGNEVETT